MSFFTSFMLFSLLVCTKNLVLMGIGLCLGLWDYVVVPSILWVVCLVSTSMLRCYIWYRWDASFSLLLSKLFWWPLLSFRCYMFLRWAPSPSLLVLGLCWGSFCSLIELLVLPCWFYRSILPLFMRWGLLSSIF